MRTAKANLALLAVALLAVALALLACSLPGFASAAQRRSPPRREAHPAKLGGAADIPAPSLPVSGASLLATGSGPPVWSINGDAQLPIASTTKMMTALVVLQHVKNLDTVFTQNHWRAQSADSQIGLVAGERMTVHDLLVALLLPSADDAAEDLANGVGRGSIPRFVAMMNAEARALGLRHTHYSTPIGLDTPGNYSSPDDLVRLGQYLMRNRPFFRETVSLPAATLTSGRYARHVVNTDDLVGRVGWIHGIKTGHTTEAGYVLVSEAMRNGLTLVGAVLGTDSEHERDASTLALLNWGFSEFHVVVAVRRGESFARPHVPYETAPALVVAARGYRTAVGRNARVEVLVSRLRRLVGPMSKGTVVGHVSVVVAGRPTVRVPLILARRLPAVSAVRRAVHLIKQPFTLLVLALLLSGAAVAVAATGRRRRPRLLAARHLEER